MDKKVFYITTPIYYVNDQPHLGTAYTSIIADIFNRYQKLFGRETFFLTGTDEHGQKCEKAAQEQNLSPKEHCDRMSLRFQETWKALNIEYDLFFRTSFSWHKSVVQKILQKLYEKGDIYSDTYKGWYCVSEEIFYTEKDLVNGLSPSGREVIALEEKAWFFKMSKYQKALEKHLEEHPQFIQPSSRQNEIKGFLKEPLRDLCISRPKSRVSWGVELPFDKNCVAYVWVDALLNYITGADYLKEDLSFRKKWIEGEVVQLIGKDILMTHAVYWTCLLMALDLPLPKTLFAHGWLLNKSSEKMSKSKGDKLDPIELSQSLGVEGLRWFLAREVILGSDLAVSPSLMARRINEDLADNLGNIFSRISRLIEKNFDGQIKPVSSSSEDSYLKNLTEKKVKDFKKQIDALELSQALSSLSSLLTEVNKYLEQKAPWKLVKTDKKQAEAVLYNALEVLRICAILFAPVLPEKMKQLLTELGEEVHFKNVSWGGFAFKKRIRHSPALFPKIENK